MDESAISSSAGKPCEHPCARKDPSRALRASVPFPEACAWRVPSNDAGLRPEVAAPGLRLRPSRTGHLRFAARDGSTLPAEYRERKGRVPAVTSCTANRTEARKAREGKALVQSALVDESAMSSRGRKRCKHPCARKDPSRVLPASVRFPEACAWGAPPNIINRLQNLPGLRHY